MSKCFVVLLREKNVALLFAFVDLEKAFDRVPRKIVETNGGGRVVG